MRNFAETHADDLNALNLEFRRSCDEAIAQQQAAYKIGRARGVQDAQAQIKRLTAALDRIAGLTASQYFNRADMVDDIQCIARAALASVKGEGC